MKTCITQTSLYGCYPLKSQSDPAGKENTEGEFERDRKRNPLYHNTVSKDFLLKEKSYQQNELHSAFTENGL